MLTILAILILVCALLFIAWAVRHSYQVLSRRDAHIATAFFISIPVLAGLLVYLL